MRDGGLPLLGYTPEPRFLYAEFREKVIAPGVDYLGPISRTPSVGSMRFDANPRIGDRRLDTRGRSVPARCSNNPCLV